MVATRATIEKKMSDWITVAPGLEATLKSNWEGARPRMKSHFRAVGFKETRVKKYESRIDAATYRTDWTKWKENYLAAMF